MVLLMFRPQFKSPVHFFKAPLRVFKQPAHKQGNEQALNILRCTNRTLPASSGSMVKMCSPSKRPGIRKCPSQRSSRLSSPLARRMKGFH